jgi:hypothetical protein
MVLLLRAEWVLQRTRIRRDAMKKRTLTVLVLLALGLASRAMGKTYKYSYPNACSEMWLAVKATLGDDKSYAQVKVDDTKMTADYQPKHEVHFDVSGVVLQRMNHVTLLTPKGGGCEMEVVSNWSGWGHEDQGDFKKRVDESLAVIKAAPAGEPAVAPAKSTEGAKPAGEDKTAKPADPAD